MNDKPKDGTPRKGSGPGKLRKISWGLMVVLVLWLTYFVYQKFGVGDAWLWVQDVAMLVFVFMLVIAAAAGVVWIMMVIRKRQGRL